MTLTTYERNSVHLWHGDCLQVLRSLPSASVSSIVTDPPYGLSELSQTQVVKALTAWVSGDREHVPDGRGFMGKDWDRFVPPPAVFDECLRVLKPGGWLLCFAGSRTVDLMTLSIRLAGFELRDSIAWLYGSGFPKSLDVSKAIDKAAGAEREVIGPSPFAARKPNGSAGVTSVGLSATAGHDLTAPATEDAARWQGWGTALKPAFEPIVVARKPLAGTVAANVLQHGTGALNIDACRVGNDPRHNPSAGNKPGGASLQMSVMGMPQDAAGREATGRWPTNVVLAHSPDCDVRYEDSDEVRIEGPCAPDCSIAKLDQQTGTLRSSGVYQGDGSRRPGDHATDFGEGHRPAAMYNDHGGASRFFPVFKYQAKAPSKERPKVDGVAHPTVKPLALMRWLVRLVTPPGGLVLDPFAGSGTTGEACVLEKFGCIMIESESSYLPLIEQRLRRSTQL